MSSAAPPFPILSSSPMPGVSSQSGSAMTKTTRLDTQNCGFDPARLERFLRDKFPHDTTKTAAKALGTSFRNVENWLAHRASPGFLNVGVMIDRWGVEFLVAVMDPPPPWAIDALARLELDDLERRRAALMNRLQEAAGGRGLSV